MVHEQDKDERKALALFEPGSPGAERVRLHYIHFKELAQSEAAWDRYCSRNPRSTRGENERNNAERKQRYADTRQQA